MSRRAIRLPLTGGCNCGAVRYEVTEPLARASYRHCRRCQRRSGAAASPQAHPAPGAFRIVAGRETLRVWKPRDGGEKWFCGGCGSAVFGCNDGHPEPIGIRMGTFDDDPGIRPSVRQFVACAAPWEPLADDGMPRFPDSRSRLTKLVKRTTAPAAGSLGLAGAERGRANPGARAERFQGDRRRAA